MLKTAIASISTVLVPVICNILFAIVVFLVGKALINFVLKHLTKSTLLKRLDGAVRTFTLSFVKIGLYVLLVISIVRILGVDVSAIITVLASAGVAVGLALQGALGNLAGGIMLLVFKPFKLGDYVDAAGVSGTVKEVTLFYTVLTTLDNRRITVPNGSLMNANIVDYSAEDVRRVDLTFACAKTESPAHVQEIILRAMQSNPMVLTAPDGPFARLSGGTNEAMEFVARAWCRSADYWTVYFDLTQSITEALGAAGIKAPAVRVTTENK